MVFFTCDACGESLKKASVEKHYQFQCRNCSVLSCVDCGKDFYGDAYKEHIKCISEAEKYSGKDYKPKENANKGEAKQNQWIEQVQSAINKNKSNPRLRGLLERLEEYPNIPRKKAKFENFIKNSLGVRDAGLAARTWEVIAAELSQPQAQNGNVQQKEPQDNKSQPQKQNGVASTEEDNNNNSEEVSEKKLSKRERKEERRKLQNKEEKKEKKRKKSQQDEEEVDEAPSKKKKNKKRKHEEVENNEEEESVEPSKSKKKKKKHGDTEEPEQGAEELEEEESKPAEKFSWEAAIIGVLKREDDKEIGIKKLRKKVLAQYHALGGDSKIKTEEELLGKFNKKVNKNPRLRVLKDRVKLVQ